MCIKASLITVDDRNERALIASVVGSSMVLKSTVPYSLQGSVLEVIVRLLIVFAVIQGWLANDDDGA